MKKLISSICSVVLVALVVVSCTGRTPSEPVKVSRAEPSAAVPALPPPPPPLPIDPCKIYEKIPGVLPVSLPGKGVVLSRIMRPCISRDGKRGYEKGSPYLAMGVPCSGGSGRIDIKGHYYSPKQVSFIIGTDCLMNPSNTSEVHSLIAGYFGLNDENKLLAYTPFVVQYWEVSGTTDADVGFSVDLSSTLGTQTLWKQFRANAPIRVELYGRENAWVKGESFFHVTVDLIYSDRKSFRLDVISVENLAPEKIEEVKSRCEGLKPRRKCLEVF